MAFYKDVDGAIWLTGTRDDQLYCIVDPTTEGDVPAVGGAMDVGKMRAAFGPFVEVRPTGWEEV
jgi:hypothetical protein